MSELAILRRTIQELQSRIAALEAGQRSRVASVQTYRPCVVKVIGQFTDAGVKSLHKYTAVVLSGESTAKLRGDLAMPEGMFTPDQDFKCLALDIGSQNESANRFTDVSEANPKYAIGLVVGWQAAEKGLVAEGEGRCIVAFGGGGGGAAGKFGKISSYTPGANAVLLTPCDSAGTASGAPDILATIELPTGKTICSFFAGVVGNVVAYATVEDVNFLLSYPLPHSIVKNQVFQVSATSGGGFDSVRIKL